MFGSKPANAPTPASAGGGGRARVDYAEQLRDAKKAKDEKEAEIQQCELSMARYQETAQVAKARCDKEGSFLATPPPPPPSFQVSCLHPISCSSTPATGEEFNLALKLQEATNLRRLRTFFLQNAACAAQVQEDRDNDEQMRLWGDDCFLPPIASNSEVDEIFF